MAHVNSGGLEHEESMRRVNGTLMRTVYNAQRMTVQEYTVRSNVEELPNMPADIRSSVY